MTEVRRIRRSMKLSVLNINNIEIEINQDISSFEMRDTEDKVNALKLIQKELSTVYKEFMEICEDEEWEACAEDFQTQNKRIDKLRVAVLRHSDTLKDSTDVKPKPAEVQGRPEVRLPTLELPTFSGQIEDWLSFQDLFKASVHNNSRLTNAQKLKYLKASTKGDAARMIKNLAITDANYEIAQGILEERFSRKRELLFCHIDKLNGQPKLVTENSADLLRMVDSTTETIRCLETLGQQITGFADTLILHSLVQKLDSGTRAWWERSINQNEIPLLESLLTFLKNHARTLKATPKSSFTKPRPPTTKQTYLNTTRPESNCIQCNGMHSTKDCTQFKNLNIKERRTVIKEKRACFNCLRLGHGSLDCWSKVNCQRCNKKHHTLLHDEPTEPSRNPDTPGIEKSGITSCHLENNSEILLATAAIRIKDSKGQFKNCRAMIDTGSQVSLITESCAKRLNLHVIPTNSHIAGIGSTSLKGPVGATKIEFTPHHDRSKVLYAKPLVIQRVTTNLPHTRINTSETLHLTELALADPRFYEPAPIDLLLGADISFLLLKGGKTLGPAGTLFRF